MQIAQRIYCADNYLQREKLKKEIHNSTSKYELAKINASDLLIQSANLRQNIF